jgi:branched-chain amino acid transport system substrate-binding protein
LLLILAVLAGGCRPTDIEDAGSGKGEIVVGVLEDLSGPLASTVGPQKDGVVDAYRYVNEELDGILGHPVKLVVIDFRMDPALATSGWDRLKNEGAVLVHSGSAAAARMLVTACQQDRIPIIGSSSDADELFPKESSFLFSTFPHMYGTFNAMCSIIEKDWAQKGESRKPRVGFDVIAFGMYQKIFSKISKLVAEKRAWDYIITNTGISPADVTTQVMQVKDFKCDYIYLHSSNPAVIAWLKEMDRQGFEPEILGTLALGDPETWRATGELCIGTRFYQHGPQWSETDLEGIKLLHDLNAKWHPDVESRPGIYPRGFSHAMAMAEALKRATQQVGYENINGEAVKAAIETMTGVDPMKWGAPYTWTATDHQGTPGCLWYKWSDGGSMERISEWINYEPLPEEWRVNAWWLTD